MADAPDFKFVLECPQYGCDTWMATTSTTAGAFEAPPTCYCPEHDDWVEMNAEAVKEGGDP